MTYEMRSPACKLAVWRSPAVERSAGEISTESCEVMASDGEPVIDLRGNTARTSLPFSAGGITTFAGAGTAEGRGAGFGASVGLGDGIALGSAESRRALGPEAVAGGGASGSGVGLVAGAEFSTAELVELLRSSGWFSSSADGFDSLGSSEGDGLGFLEGAAAAADLENVGVFWNFASGGCAVSSLFVLRKLSESSLIRGFGKDGSVGVARVPKFGEREGAGRLSGCKASAGGASSLPAGSEVAGSLGKIGGACDVATRRGAGLRMFRRRFSIGAYPAVSPRMKLIATNTKPNMAN